MSIKCAVYIAISLDGYIARANGDLDWLPVPEAGGEDYGYQMFSDSIDTIVMGRGTYEKALTFGGWPYMGKRTVVLSSGSPPISDALKSHVEISALAPRQLIAHLETTGTRSIYVDGGKTIQSFLREDLVDEITLTVVPVLIGHGLPLFGALNRDIHLHLETVRSFPKGLAQSKYTVLR